MSSQVVSTGPFLHDGICLHRPCGTSVATAPNWNRTWLRTAGGHSPANQIQTRERSLNDGGGRSAQPIVEQRHIDRPKIVGKRNSSPGPVRRDPGATLIWVAAGLLLAGLLVTFYVPRLRLWARVRPQETVIAGPAERGGAFQTEAKRLARELGVRTVDNKQEVDEDG